MTWSSLDFETELRVWQQICSEVFDEPHRAFLRGHMNSPTIREVSDDPNVPGKVIQEEQLMHMFYAQLPTTPKHVGRGFGKIFVPFGDATEWHAALRDEVVSWYARVKRERAERNGV